MRHLQTRLLAGALVASSCALLGWAGAATSDAVVVRPDAKPTPTRTTTYPWPTSTRNTPAPTKTTTAPAPTKTAPPPTTSAPRPTTTAPRPTLSTTTAPVQPPGTKTSITLTAPSAVAQGEIVTLRGTLTAASGSISGGAVDLGCGTGTPMSVPVASTGAFTGFVEIPVNQAPGRILCTASFDGGGGLSGSSRSVPVTVEAYRTPTPDPTPSDETPSPTQPAEEPTSSESPTVATATPVAVGGTSTTNVPFVLLIIGGAVTSVVTVGGMAFTAARGRRINPDGWDSLIAPVTPPRRLAE